MLGAVTDVVSVFNEHGTSRERAQERALNRALIASTDDDWYQLNHRSALLYKKVCTRKRIAETCPARDARCSRRLWKEFRGWQRQMNALFTASSVVGWQRVMVAVTKSMGEIHVFSDKSSSLPEAGDVRRHVQQLLTREDTLARISVAVSWPLDEEELRAFRERTAQFKRIRPRSWESGGAG